LLPEEADLLEVLVYDEVEALALPIHELSRLMRPSGVFMKEHFAQILKTVAQRVNDECGQNRGIDDLRGEVISQLSRVSADPRLALKTMSARLKPLESAQILPETELQELAENRQWLQKIKPLRVGSKGSDILILAQALAFFIDERGVTVPPTVLRGMNNVASALRKNTFITKVDKEDTLKVLDSFNTRHITKEVGSIWTRMYPQEVSSQSDLLPIAGLLSYYEQLSSSTERQIDALKQELGSDSVLYRPERRDQIGPELEYAENLRREAQQRYRIIRDGLQFLRNLLQ
jgi:hypothetical protein